MKKMDVGSYDCLTR